MYEEITKATYNNIAEEYSRRTVFPSFRNIIKKSASLFISVLPNNRKSNLLVLGSGDGRDALLFINTVEQIILYDYSQKMMTIAKNRLPSAEYIVDDFRNINFKQNSIDAIWASTCLYHVQKVHLPQIIDKLFFVIKPEGLLYINLKKGKGEKLVKNPSSFPEGGSRFYAYYTKREILRLFRKFELVFYKDDHPEIDIAYMQLILKKK